MSIEVLEDASAELVGNNQSEKDDEHLSQSVLNNCIICSKTDACYKCPTCFRKYCSVSCCKTHKTDCKPLEKPEVRVELEDRNPAAERNYYYPTKDTVPRGKLQMLAEGQNLVDLKKFLENPEIRSNILKLNTCSDPISAFNEIMEDDNFVKFASFITDSLSKDK